MERTSSIESTASNISSVRTESMSTVILSDSSRQSLVDLPAKQKGFNWFCFNSDKNTTNCCIQ
jgi:hypothetical protein